MPCLPYYLIMLLHISDVITIILLLCLLIAKHCFYSLYSVAQQIQQTLGVSLDSNELFPEEPGSHLSLTNPALEFVKYVCQVLSLDSTTQHQVNKLR